MKLKQVLFTVALSAITTLAVLWGFSKFSKTNNAYAGQESGVVPSNYRYAGLFDGNGPGNGAVDFTAPAAAATRRGAHQNQNQCQAGKQ